MKIKESTVSTDFDVFPADFDPLKGEYNKKLKKGKKKRKKKKAKKIIIRQGPDYYASQALGIE